MALLRFDKRGEVLETAFEMFGLRRRMPLRVQREGPNIVRVGDMIPFQLVEYLRNTPPARTAVRRIVRNAGKRATDRIKREVRKLDLISPQGAPTRGLYLSSWRAELRDITQIGIGADLAIVNAAPYALYVHPKGTPKTETFINRVLPDIMAEIAAEISQDLRQLINRIFKR